MTKRDLRPATWCRSADAFSLKQPHTSSSPAAAQLPPRVRFCPFLTRSFFRFCQFYSLKNTSSGVNAMKFLRAMIDKGGAIDYRPL